MAIATQPLVVTPAHPLFAAEVSGVDLTRPLDDLGLFQDQGAHLTAIMKGGRFHKNRLT